MTLLDKDTTLKYLKILELKMAQGTLSTQAAVQQLPINERKKAIKTMIDLHRLKATDELFMKFGVEED